MKRFAGSALLEWGGAAFIVSLGMIAGFLLGDTGVKAPYLALFPPIVIICHSFGIRRALVSELLGGLFSWYAFLEPRWSFALPDRGDAVQFLSFLAILLFGCWIIENQRRFIHSLEEALDQALDDAAPTLRRDQTAYPK